MIKEEVNKFINKINSRQYSNVLLSHSTVSNYAVTLSEIQTHCETIVSNDSVSCQLSDDVISGADYLNESLVSNEVLNKFAEIIWNE